MKFIDDFLNNTTMYRVVLYVLIGLLLAATVLSYFGVLPFSPFNLLVSVIFILLICWVTNLVYSKTYQAPTNIESVYITALILALIISPAKTPADFAFLFWASVWSMASKYIFAIGKKHLFNPVAVAVAITAFTVNQSASWWIGTLAMLPFTIAGGYLVVKKIRRTDMVSAFLYTAFAVVIATSFLTGHNLLTLIEQTLVESPIIFFATIMFTEPLTTPPTMILQIVYAIIVGILSSPSVHVGRFYFTPETALLAGNVFSYIVSPKIKLLLKLKDIIPVADNTYDFIFDPGRKLSFVPGQYMEWTLPHSHPDDRGNRRYFTLASSPTEKTVRIGVKINPNPSSFKKSLLDIKSNREIVATQLSGDFTLPRNPKQKLVFIAGGIGVTPFRSMIKYLIDKGEKRQIVLFYANRNVRDIAYRDVFDKAAVLLGIKTVYILSDQDHIPPGWTGRSGHINEAMIKNEVPDYKDRNFYLSGPHNMVDAFNNTLKNMGLKADQIKTDYFPGFA
jgi:glycine betaine catabolism B